MWRPNFPESLKILTDTRDGVMVLDTETSVLDSRAVISKTEGEIAY